MSSITKYELCDINKITELLDNGECLDDKDITLLQKYLKKCKNGKVEVEYKKSLGSKGKGRWYAKGGLSLQSFKKGIRHYLANELYLDIDIVNCHPVLLLKLCKDKGWKCEYINQYVNNRNNILQEFHQATGLSLKMAKEIYLTALYLKDPSKAFVEYGIFDIDMPNHLMGFYKECSMIADNLWNCQSELVKIVESKKMVDKHSNRHNPKSQLLSHYLQIEENSILSFMCEKLDAKTFDCDVLVFDGVMIRKNNNLDIKQALDDVVNDLWEEMDYDIDLIIKEMNNPITLVEDDFDIDEFEIPQQHLHSWSQEYINTLKVKNPKNTYLMRKKYLEVFSSKVLRPKPMYVVFEKNSKDIDIISDADMRERLKGINSGMINQGSGSPISLYDAWTTDTNQLKYNKFAFHPFNIEHENEPTDVYNLFKGFNPDIYAPYDKKNFDKIIKSFIKLTMIMANHNEEVFNYLIHYIALLIQFPRARPAIIIILCGDQGTGKGAWVFVIRQLVGMAQSISSSKIKDFVGDHSEGFYRKLFVNINESEGKDMFQHLGKIKEFISEKEIMINPKHLRPFAIENYAFMVVNSNSDNPFVLDVKSKERRVVLQRVSSDWLEKPTKFWDSLWDHFKKPQFISALYDYLMSFDVKNFDFRKRPITEAYINLVKLYRPGECLWLQNFINLTRWNVYLNIEFDEESFIITKKQDDVRYDTNICINMTDLYNDYKKYINDNRLHSEDKTPSLKSFENKIRSLHIPMTIVRQQGVNKMRFIPCEVYNYLENNNLIDDENTNYNNFFEKESEISAEDEDMFDC